MDSLIDAFSFLQQSLFEAVVQPLVFASGQAHLLDKAYEGTGWLVVGLLQIAVLLTVLGPMQRRWPAEPLHDPRAVRVDVAYTLIHRLGLFKLAMFFSFDWLFEQAWGSLRGLGAPTWHLDQIWPGVSDVAWLSFLIYLVVFDFVNYWLHRGQHQLPRWWALHSLHHSQRQMTMWSDNRNHLLDDVLTSLALSVVAVLVGVGPGQFVALVALGPPAPQHRHRPRDRAPRPAALGWLQLRRALALVGHAVWHRRFHAALRPHGHPRSGGKRPRLRTGLLGAAVAGCAAAVRAGLKGWLGLSFPP